MKVDTDRWNRVLLSYSLAVESGMPEEGKPHNRRLPYVGYSWRAVDDWADPPVADRGDFVGLCTVNRWGLPMRTLTAAEKLQLHRLVLRVVVRAEKQSRNTNAAVDTLWRWMQKLRGHGEWVDHHEVLRTRRAEAFELGVDATR